MRNSTHQLDAINSLGVGVRIAFHRNGDCFAHTIYGVHKDRIDAILNSVDDLDASGWPLSIPVQEIRETPFPSGGTALVLMGAAASGHWSATVRPVHFDDANPCLEFDVAVRLTRSPAYLGACYELQGEAAWAGDYSHMAFASLKPHGLVISRPLGSRNPSSEQLDLLQTRPDPVAPRLRRITPAASLPQQYPATHRWQYGIASALA